MVAIDLKLGKFKPEHEGQMLLYLRYLNKNERKEGEESPIGLVIGIVRVTGVIQLFTVGVKV